MSSDETRRPYHECRIAGHHVDETYIVGGEFTNRRFLEQISAILQSSTECAGAFHDLQGQIKLPFLLIERICAELQSTEFNDVSVFIRIEKLLDFPMFMESLQDEEAVE